MKVRILGEWADKANAEVEYVDLPDSAFVQLMDLAQQLRDEVRDGAP